MSRVIGIDLGTTNCCVAVMEGSTPTVIANRNGYKTTPSIVAVTEGGERVVGQVAARQAISNPEHTVYAFKRLIGRSFASKEVQDAISRLSYELVEGDSGEVRVVLRGQRLAVPEISAMLLQEMRVVAEDYLGEEIHQAVVTVPAYFNDHQRQAVRDAGAIAGLDVLGIINEPTSAALAYGYNQGQNKRFAVYDLGGGTFDISIVESQNDTFRVIATTGDSYLGGEDFDERIMAWLIRGFEVQQGVDLRRSPIALQRLKQAAQKAKCELSTQPRAEVQLPFIVSSGPKGPLNMHYAITRQQLEKLTTDLIERTLDICREAMVHARCTPSDIDEVLLVGGMTRMPAVQAAVEALFRRKPSKGVHPDEVVALGAAIQGAALGDEISDVNLEDVTAQALGIETGGDHFEVVIPKNTRVPVRVPSNFGTGHDFQEAIRIIVRQGDSELASENTLLGDFSVSGLRPAPAGQVEVEVAFAINDDGIFSVTAKDDEGKETFVQITGDSGLDEEEIEQMAEENAEFLKGRRAEDAHERLKQSLESLLDQVQRSMRAKRRSTGNADIIMTLTHAEHVVKGAKAALEADNRTEMSEHLVLLEDAQSSINSIA